MRTLVVATALLGMVVGLQAKEADSLRGMRGAGEAVKQLVSDQTNQLRGKAARTRAGSAKDSGFSPEVIVPDICTGC